MTGRFLFSLASIVLRLKTAFSYSGRLMLLVWFVVALVPAEGVNRLGVLDPYTRVLEDFESEDSLGRWRWDEGVEAERSDAWASTGRYSARLTFHRGSGWPNMETHRSRSGFTDWPDFSEYEYVEIDFWNPLDYPAPSRAAGSNSQGVVFHARGGHNTVSVPLEPGEKRAWKVSIHDRLAYKRGTYIDVSGIQKFHFYAWNPGQDYIRHVDNIRLTRDLGSHFGEMSAALQILESAGMEQKQLDRLRNRIQAEHKELERLPFSRENFTSARLRIEALKGEILGESIFLQNFGKRMKALLTGRGWSEDAQHTMAKLDEGLMTIQGKILAVEKRAGHIGSFEREVLKQLRDEIMLMEVDLANARSFLPYASPKQNFVLGWEHADTFVKPYGKLFQGKFDRIRLAGARGETVGAQLVVFALEEAIPGVALKASLPQAKISAIGFANIGNAAEGSLSHKLQWYPDILYPVPLKGVEVPAGRHQSFLMEIDIPQHMGAGLYTFVVEAETDTGSIELPVTLRVYDFGIPERFSLRTTSGYRVPNGLLLPDYGLDAGHLYGGWMNADEDLILEFFAKGQQLFNLQVLDEQRVDKMLEEGVDRVRKRYEPFLKRMEAIGIPRKHFFFYGLDEVSVGLADKMRKINALLREALAVPFMSTPLGNGWSEQPADTLSIWAHGLGRGEARHQRIAEVHGTGGQAWWYDNNLGFQPDVWNGRHKGWYAKHWGMDGYLIYSHRVWQDRNEKSLNLDTLPYSNWSDPGPGNAALIYWWGEKAEDGNWEGAYPSFRLWNFRAGLYDYEYLRKLELLVNRAAKDNPGPEYEEALSRARQLIAVPENIAFVPETINAVTGAMTGAVTTGSVGISGAMRQARVEVAELIEILSRAWNRPPDSPGSVE